uniref:Gag-Pol polyprotein n=1 Tax=Tanacetum cinerariifolium TaxID=118510 RepID=A0A699KTR7_TANCI|nr:Gag-Pol polyprotein [Tanacetum cinerariifolium]
MNEYKGRMPTKIELMLKQSQQGVSNDVLVSIEGVEEYAQVENDEFINIFCTLVQDRGETSSCHVDSLNMHTFYQHHPSEYRWMKDHPLEQVIRNPSQSVRTRRQLESYGEMCMFALIVSRTKPNNIKEAMADSAWIESMQEELNQFDRLDVWELVDRPLCKNVINMKCLWKNKHYVSSDPIPECHRMALGHDSLSPGTQCQDNVTQADKTVTTSNELDLLFSLMFDELLNESSKVVSKSSIVSTTDAPNQRQQLTTPLNIHITFAPTCHDPTLAPTVTSTKNMNQT